MVGNSTRELFSPARMKLKAWRKIRRAVVACAVAKSCTEEILLGGTFKACSGAEESTGVWKDMGH